MMPCGEKLSKGGLAAEGTGSGAVEWVQDLWKNPFFWLSAAIGMWGKVWLFFRSVSYWLIFDKSRRVVCHKAGRKE